MNDDKTGREVCREPCRQRTDATFSRGAEQILDSSRGSVSIHFDWVPAVSTGKLTFNVCVERGDEKSAIDFEVDLRRLTPTELERLHDFLVRRHTGLDDGYEIARGISWLLNISLDQNQPNLSPAEQQCRVRQLLLSVTASSSTLFTAPENGKRQP